MSNVCCEKATVQTQVPNQIDLLYGRLADVEALVEELEKRLLPVLALPEPTDASKGCDSVALCPLAENLQSIGSGVSGVAGRLKDILQRLEV